MKHLLRFKTFLLLAIFSLLAGTSAWAQSDFSSTETSNVTLTAGTNGSTCTVNGKDGIKVGTSSKGGDMSVTVPAGTTHLHLHAAAWNNVSGLSLNISGATATPSSISLTSNSGISGNSPFTLSGNASDYYFVIELSGITSATTLKFTTSAAKRFVIWGVNAEEVSSGSNLSQSDFALTGAPVDLSFDLYNNSGAQVINYTTSSTGAVSIANSDYATFAINETNKTITVTPTAYTPTAQTITVNQAADDTYSAGSATFTLFVDDSTPSNGDWVETALADISTGDVFVIVGNNGNNYALSNDNGTGGAPSAVGVTVSGGKITSKVSDNIKWNVTGDATNGYTFFPNGTTETWLYCTNANNGVRVGTNDSKTFTVSTEGYLVHSGTSRYVGVYDSSDWRCYTSINKNIENQTFTFYKYDDGTTPSKPSPELAFSSATAEAAIGQPFTAPTLTTAAGFNGTVEYSSSNESVAQVMDTETGELRLISAGETVIKASFAGNDDFKSGSASYTLTVTDNRIPTTISQDPILLTLAEVGTLTKLAPVVKDENDNVVAYTYGQWPTEVSFEVVNDPNSLIGSLDNNSGDITINSVQGTATLKAYYNYYNVNSTYRPSECTFTISVLEPKDGIAEFCTLNNNESGTLKLTNAVVLYTHGNDMFVKDATGAMDFYSTSLSYNVGDVLNGTITGTYKLYNGMPELTTPISENTLVATAGSAPTPDEITTSDAADNVCNLVKLSSATVTESSSKFYVDGIQIYDKFKLGYTIEAGKTYDIVGIMIPYNSTYELCPTEAPVEVNASTTPSITITPDSYNMDAKAGGGELPVTCSNMPADPQLEVLFYESDGTTPATYTWISAVINSNGNIDGQIEENTGDARTAYFKVHGVDANNNDVYSNLVTFTQSGPSIEFENPSIDIAAGGESRTLGFTYAGVGSTADDFEVCFYESDGNTAATYDWITPSFKTESSKVKLDITVDANTGVARTAYFKVHAKNTTVYSNLYTVNQAAAPAATEINLTKTLVFDIEDNGDLSGTYATNNTKTNLYGKWEGDATATEFEGFTFNQISKQNSFQFQANAGSLTFPTIKSAYGFDVTYVATQNDVTVTINNDETLTTTATEATLVLARTASGAARITSITLTPKAAPGPSITLPAGYQYDVNADGGDNELPVVCENLASNPQLTVVFVEADGVTPATYDWISATINNSGNIDGHIDVNTGAARTAYFVVTGKDADDNTIYSNLVTINQAAPAAPSIVFNPNSIDFDANSGSKTIGGDYFQLKDFDSTPSLEILYYESDGETSATYDWFTANVNTEGKIELVYNDNTGAARSAYLKIHAVGTTVYSNLFTVNQAAPTTDYVTLPFNWAGGASADLTAIAGVTASGIGSDYAATHDPYLVKFDSDGDYIQFKTNEQPGVVTIGVKMIGGGNTSTITVQGSADGDKFTDIEELTISGKQNDFLTLATTNEFDSSVRYIRLNFTKGSNVGVGPISIALPALVATPTFDPAAGEVQAGTLVTISTTTANATIRYTTDGSEPTTLHGEEYDKPIVINSAVTIKAIAVDDNWNVSAVAEATYTIATSSQLSPELTLDPKSLNVTEGAANGTVTVTTAAGYNGTITVMVDDPSVADASYDAGIITVVYGHAGSAVISVTAGADGDYVEQMEQISVNVSAPVQPAQAGVVVWSEDWSSFNLNDSETPAANGDFTYTYTDGNSATKLYNENSAGSTAPELLINKNGGKNGGAFSATIPLYGAYGNMTLTFKTNNKLTEVRAKVDDDTNNDITLDPANVNGKNVYTLSFPVAEGANQVVLTFTNNTSKNVRIDDFQLTAPQVAVNISSVGYSTMYYGSSNLTVPAGVTVSTYWVDGDLLKVSQEYKEGAVLAKAQGYVLSGTPGSYTFTATDDVANEDPKNALRGFDTAAQTTGGSTYFLLGVYNNKVGFYWGADNGAAFKSGSHKAYLAAPAGTGVRAFYFDDVYTGVDALNLNVENENAYDMQGRRVQQLQKGGLYILNGKKVLVK